jgi:hypothetical protein
MLRYVKPRALHVSLSFRPLHSIYEATNKIKRADSPHEAVELYKTVERPDAIIMATLLRHLRDHKCAQHGLFLVDDIIRHDISDKNLLFSIMSLCIEFNSESLPRIVEKSIQLGIVCPYLHD